MAYSLRPGHSVLHEVKRVADKQLALALAQLQQVGTPRADQGVRESRRHIKKVRALLRLVQPVLVAGYEGSSRRLRRANRLLAPVADGRAVIATIDGLAARRPEAAAALAAIRRALVQRIGRVDRRIETQHVLHKVTRLLILERTRIDGWTLRAGGMRAVAPGLARSRRRARKAMARAMVHPTAENYHRFRQRVKDHWLHVRLAAARTGRALTADRRRLEALDECLGEYHNVLLIEDILLREAPVLRTDLTNGLKVSRSYQVELRRRAMRLAEAALGEKPQPLLSRLKPLWKDDGRGAVSARRRKSRGSARALPGRRQGRRAHPPRRRGAARSAARSLAGRRSAPAARIHLRH